MAVRHFATAHEKFIRKICFYTKKKGTAEDMEIDNKTPVYETVMKKFCCDFPSDENKQHGYSVAL